MKLIFFFGLLFTASIAAADPLLTVTGPEKTLTLTADEFKDLPRLTLSAPEPHTRIERRYAGVRVQDLLSRIDAPFGQRLRGPAQQMAVLIRATDDYAIIFSLADLDEAYGNRTVLVADSEDGGPLPARVGPLRLVVPADQGGSRWIRNIRSIELVTVGTVRPRPKDRPSPTPVGGVSHPD